MSCNLDFESDSDSTNTVVYHSSADSTDTESSTESTFAASTDYGPSGDWLAIGELSGDDGAASVATTANNRELQRRAQHRAGWAVMQGATPRWNQPTETTTGLLYTATRPQEYIQEYIVYRKWPVYREFMICLDFPEDLPRRRGYVEGGEVIISR